MSSALPLPAATRVCRGQCGRELPLTDEYFRPVPPDARFPAAGRFRHKCRRCCHTEDRGRLLAHVKEGQAAKAAKPAGKWNPRVVGEGGPEGGYTEHPEDGYRFLCVPDSHGDLIDWTAAEALLAFIRFYRPIRIFMLGDHVDFAAFSRFEQPPTDKDRIATDVAACRKFLGMVRESAPDARITYLKGNHEQRFQRFLWKNETAAQVIATALNVEVPRVPDMLRLSEHGIEWEESGTVVVNDRLMMKHGHMVRQRSGYTGHGELDRNGITGISGHTHRLGQIYRRNRTGIMTWVESGCICKYDPDYMEGQVSEWAQGLSFGTVSLRGHGFAVHTAPIIKGRVKCAFAEIGP